MAIGLLAATLQMVAHTAAKSLLFSSAAGIEAVGGGDVSKPCAASDAGRRGAASASRWAR